jgi:hypothetical protein
MIAYGNAIGIVHKNPYPERVQETMGDRGIKMTTMLRIFVCPWILSIHLNGVIY